MDWFLYDMDLHHENVKDVWQDPIDASASFFNILPEAVTQRCSLKKVFLKISQKSQENTCVGVTFLTKFLASTWITSQWTQIT